MAAARLTGEKLYSKGYHSHTEVKNNDNNHLHENTGYSPTFLDLSFFNTGVSVRQVSECPLQPMESQAGQGIAWSPLTHPKNTTHPEETESLSQLCSLY